MGVRHDGVALGQQLERQSGEPAVSRVRSFVLAAILACGPAAPGLPAAPATSTAKATPSAAAAPSPTVDEIVARHVAWRGGLKKIRAIQTLREQGRVSAGADRQGVVTRERKRPNQSRFEFTVQGVTSVFLSDGQRGWKMSPFDGDTGPSPLPEEVVAEAAEQADIEGPLVEWQAKGHKVELDGRESVGGRETYRLKLTLKSGGVRTEYLDVKTLERVRTDSTRTVKGRPVRIETTYGDYKKSGGVQFPRRIDVEAAGRPQRLQVMVDTIEINPPLSDERFRLPSQAQR
jgi:outer membrane lipoprotein-sorting protein